MTTLNRLLRATVDRPLIWPGVVGAFSESFVVDLLRVSFRLVFQRPAKGDK